MDRETKIIGLIETDKKKYAASSKILKDFLKKSLVQYLSDLKQISEFFCLKKISYEVSYNKFKFVTDKILKRCLLLEKEIKDRKIIKEIKGFFRSLVGPYIYKGKLVSWAFKKPYGYPGDYKIIEAIYNNDEISKSFRFFSDRYLLQDQYANAIRARKNGMKKILFNYFKTSNQNSVKKIMNLGCGSCREIREILSNRFEAKKIFFDLIDQDEDALEFSKVNISNILKNMQLENKVVVKVHKINMLELLKKKNKYKRLFKKKDFIYNIGLADYLPDSILLGLIKLCFNLLNSEGQLVIAHKDIKKYKPIASDWFCDWGNFFMREKQDILHLITVALGKNNFNLKTERDKTGRILFFIIIKK